MSELATRMGVPSTSISSVMRRLQDMMILHTDNRVACLVTDVVFGTWLVGSSQVWR